MRRPPALSLVLALTAGGAAAQVPQFEPLRMNQAGFEVQGPKAATLASTRTTPLPWRVTDVQGAVVTEGSTRVFGADVASGETVHVVDFSALTRPGSDYQLEVDGHAARPFTVSARPFARLKYDALAYFYQNRAGVPILAEHVARPDLARPAGHAREEVLV